MIDSNASTTLKRVIGLPMLVFYGVGVTVGAGVFALIGELVGIAGDHAPVSFLIAGLIATSTGISYAILAEVYPRAAGEAYYVKTGLGDGLGLLVGIGVVITAVASSAAITLAFAAYLGSLVPVGKTLASLGLLCGLTLVAWRGVRETVIFAALITLMEVGALGVVIVYGLPLLIDPQTVQNSFSLPSQSGTWGLIFAGGVIAFFAFMGFEDVENMAEETINPQRNVPLAILLTLVITVVIYVAVSLIATALPNRAELVASDAPMGYVFAQLTDMSATPMSVVAAIAMINGILVQIVMASRVLYGMGRDRLIPEVFAHLDPDRRTPIFAIVFVAVIVAILALAFPLLGLAQATSLVMLIVFTLVNIALWRIGSRAPTGERIHRWRYWGLIGAAVCTTMIALELLRIVSDL